MSKLFLKIGEVPSNIFVDDSFQIPVFLVDEADKLNCPLPQYSRVTVRVQLEDALSNLPVSLLDIDQGSCIIRPQGTGQITMTFRNVSMNFENRRFIIHISMNNDIREVVGASTPPIFVISQQLVILEEFSAPYTWYKDEGGKDKYIEYTVFMVDRQGNHVRDKRVSLKVTLMYRNGHPVPQQNIMTISPDSKLVLDRSGQTTIRIRINEVSTRHQGQYFQVLIGPDIATGPSTADVCSVLSIPIDVKSKRNHHKERERDRDRSDRDFVGKISGNGGGFRLESSESEGPLKRAKLDGAASLTAAAGLLDRERDKHGTCIHDPLHPPENCQCHDKILAGINLISDSSGSHTICYKKPVNLSAAIANVVLWTKTVMDAMDTIQWKQIGYSTFSDGSPDPDKPLFNIPNPHDTITTVVQEYAGHVKDSLHLLGTLADAEMPTLPIAFHPDEERFEADSSMTSLMDIWGTEDNLVMPSLMRGISSHRINFGIDKPNLTRNHSLFLESDLSLPSSNGAISESKVALTVPVAELGPPLTPSPSDVTDLEEKSVYYILAVLVPDLGLPTFDKDKRLIGFYKDSVKNGTTSSAVFTPLTKLEYHPLLHKESFDNTVDKAIKEGTNALLSRPNFGDDVRRMREDALIHFMIHNAGDNIIPHV